MHHDKLSETRSKAGRELVYCSLDIYNVGKHKLVTDSTSVVGLNVCAYLHTLGINLGIKA